MGESEQIEKFSHGDIIYVTFKLEPIRFYIFNKYVLDFYEGNMIEAINLRTREVCILSPLICKAFPLTRSVLFEKCLFSGKR